MHYVSSKWLYLHVHLLNIRQCKKHLKGTRSFPKKRVAHFCPKLICRVVQMSCCSNVLLLKCLVQISCSSKCRVVQYPAAQNVVLFKYPAAQNVVLFKFPAAQNVVLLKCPFAQMSCCSNILQLKMSCC